MAIFTGFTTAPIHSSKNKPQCTLLIRQLKLCTTDQNHPDRQLVHSSPKQRRAMVSVSITSSPLPTMLLSLLHFCSLSQHAPRFHQNSYHTQALHSILAPVQEPHLGWHQLAAPQKSAPVPQKLLPEQQSPAAHLALTIGPQVSPALAVLGVAEEYGGGFLVRAQSPKLPWQPAPQ